MKKLLVFGLILLMITLLVPAKQTEAHGYYWGGFWPGFAIGGLLGFGLSPYYYYPRYYYPPPAYYYPPPTYYYYSAPSPGTPPATNVTPPPPTGYSSGGRMFIYPRQNQNETRQAKDRDECHQWAVGQTGFDPGRVLPGGSDAQTMEKGDEYFRAISACLDAKGYTVR